MQTTLLDQMVAFFLSAFRFRGLSWKLVLIAIALGLVFGAIWLLLYRLPLKKQRWLWLIAPVSAFLTWAAVSFIQIPLQSWTSQVLLHFWSPLTLSRWLLLAGIPSILLSGLIQEGSKMVPVVFSWLRGHREITVETGLMAGAIAGAGFGVFEAVWVHNTLFAAGWTLHSIQTGGILALTGFWERFFTVGFHIAVSALAGYGLARGMGWQFYLIASFLHGAVNYVVVLAEKGLLTTVSVEVYIAAFAVALTVVVLWLRVRSRSAREGAVAP